MEEVPFHPVPVEPQSCRVNNEGKCSAMIATWNQGPEVRRNDSNEQVCRTVCGSNVEAVNKKNTVLHAE